jgi:hypothetical protein
LHAKKAKLIFATIKRAPFARERENGFETKEKKKTFFFVFMQISLSTSEQDSQKIFGRFFFAEKQYQKRKVYIFEFLRYKSNSINTFSFR